MGLDTVELVMDLEDEFGISIPDEEAERIQTVGQTVDYIVSVLAGRSCPALGICPSARQFYALRRGLGTTFGVPREQARPAAEIGELIPAGPARAGWGKFARELNLPHPPFSYRAREYGASPKKPGFQVLALLAPWSRFRRLAPILPAPALPPYQRSDGVRNRW